MLVLDENLPESQRQLLLKKGVRFRSVGEDFVLLGSSDENILPALRLVSHPTFFSLDSHFFFGQKADLHYSLVWLDIPSNQSAAYIIRFLKHKAFNTQRKRMGSVIRLHSGGINFWKGKLRHLLTVSWDD
jgi:hypothetical protein